MKYLRKIYNRLFCLFRTYNQFFGLQNRMQFINFQLIIEEKTSWKPYENYFWNHSSSAFQSSLLNFSIFYESISSIYIFPSICGEWHGAHSIEFHRLLSIEAKDDSPNINSEMQSRLVDNRKRLSHNTKTNDNGKRMSVINVNYSIVKCAINSMSYNFIGVFVTCFCLWAKRYVMDKKLKKQ